MSFRFVSPHLATAGFFLLCLFCPGCLVCGPAAPGCLKDTDCKGRRVCVAGRCVIPPETGKVLCPCPPNKGRAKPRPRPRPLELELEPSDLYAPWPMFRADRHRSGLARFEGPSSRPKVAWRFKTQGPISSSPAVGPDGTVYFGSHDRHIYAVTAKGALLWKAATGDKVWSSPALSKDGKQVFCGSDDDHIYGLDTRTGAVAFKVRLGTCEKPTGFGPVGARCDQDASVAVGPDGTLYAGGEGITALSPKGEVLWTYSLRRHVRSSPAVRADGRVFFSSQDDRVYALNKKGRMVWSFPTGNDVESTPALGRDGTVYVGSDDRRLYALHPTGARKWAVLTGGPVRSSPAVGSDGTIYFGSHDGRVYAVEPERGKVRWVYATAGRIEASVTLDSKGRIYFGSQDGILYCLNRDGALVWRLRLNADLDSSPAIVASGRVYIGSDDGCLYALDPSKQKP